MLAFGVFGSGEIGAGDCGDNGRCCGAQLVIVSRPMRFDFYDPIFPLQALWLQSQRRSGVSSMAEHCTLQYSVSGPTSQVHGGWAHVFTSANFSFMAGSPFLCGPENLWGDIRRMGPELS